MLLSPSTLEMLPPSLYLGMYRVEYSAESFSLLGLGRVLIDTRPSSLLVCKQLDFFVYLNPSNQFNGSNFSFYAGTATCNCFRFEETSFPFFSQMWCNEFKNQHAIDVCDVTTFQARSNGTQWRQRLAIVKIFLRSCVLQMLNHGYGLATRF